MQILDNRNWEFPMGFTSRLIRKPTAGRVRLFGESWKGHRSAINKRVPIWFVLNYRQSSPTQLHVIITTRSEYTMSNDIIMNLQSAEMHALRLQFQFLCNKKNTILILKSLCKYVNVKITGVTCQCAVTIHCNLIWIGYTHLQYNEHILLLLYIIHIFIIIITRMSKCILRTFIIKV